MSEWRPMETSRRDGSAVLLRLEKPLKHHSNRSWLGELRVTIGAFTAWDGDEGHWYSLETEFHDEEWYAPDFEGAEQDVSPAGQHHISVEPTGWMPLPEP